MLHCCRMRGMNCDLKKAGGCVAFGILVLVKENCFIRTLFSPSQLLAAPHLLLLNHHAADLDG